MLLFSKDINSNHKDREKLLGFMQVPVRSVSMLNNIKSEMSQSIIVSFSDS